MCPSPDGRRITNAHLEQVAEFETVAFFHQQAKWWTSWALVFLLEDLVVGDLILSHTNMTPAGE